MALTFGQVSTARLLVRSFIKNALDVENELDELLQKQQGDIKGVIQNVEALASLVKAAQGSLVEQPDPKPETAAAPAETTAPPATA
jgi:hypothetical protein